MLGHQLDAVKAMLDARYGAGTIAVGTKLVPVIAGPGAQVRIKLPLGPIAPVRLPTR